MGGGAPVAHRPDQNSEITSASSDALFLTHHSRQVGDDGAVEAGVEVGDAGVGVVEAAAGEGVEGEIGPRGQVG
jgi:hypothetical protein